jgi:hypothetical protein
MSSRREAAPDPVLIMSPYRMRRRKARCRVETGSSANSKERRFSGDFARAARLNAPALLAALQRQSL